MKGTIQALEGRKQAKEENKKQKKKGTAKTRNVRERTGVGRGTQTLVGRKRAMERSRHAI